MADKFFALSNIEHGEARGDGGVDVFNFPYGSEVKGLKPETMENLWNAGVLERRADVAPPEATVRSVPPKEETPAAPAEPGAGDDKAPAE